MTTSIPSIGGQEAIRITIVFIAGIGKLEADIGRLSEIERLAPYELDRLLEQVALE